MSLRRMLLGTLALVLLSTLILASWLTYRHALHKIETEMQAALAVGARIAHNAVDDVEEVTNPRRRLELLVADFDGDRHLKARLVEPDGSVKITSRLQLDEQSVPAWLERLLDWKPQIVKLKLPSVFDGVGQFELQTDARNEIAEALSDIKLFSIVLGFFCIGSVAVAYLVLARALTPIEALVASFERIGAGDYEPRMHEDGSTEFSSLARGFNKMAGRLSDMEGRNARLLRHLETVQEEERSELARNLHDEVSPLLFCIDVDAMSIGRRADDIRDTVIQDHVHSIHSAIGDLKGNVKSILSDLRPSSLHALSMQEAIDDLVDFWKSRQPGVAFDVEIDVPRISSKIDDAVVAIVRESLANAFKHGAPRRVRIAVKSNGTDALAWVEDNGGGLTRPITEGGFGILGMKERASKLDGEVTVSPSATGSGVLVHARIPIVRPAMTSEPVISKEMAYENTHS